MSAPFIDYYEVLHVERGTSVEDINRAFRRQSVLTVVSRFTGPPFLVANMFAESKQDSSQIARACLCPDFTLLLDAGCVLHDFFPVARTLISD